MNSRLGLTWWFDPKIQKPQKEKDTNVFPTSERVSLFKRRRWRELAGGTEETSFTLRATTRIESLVESAQAGVYSGRNGWLEILLQRKLCTTRPAEFLCVLGSPWFRGSSTWKLMMGRLFLEIFVDKLKLGGGFCRNIMEIILYHTFCWAFVCTWHSLIPWTVYVKANSAGFF